MAARSRLPAHVLAYLFAALLLFANASPLHAHEIRPALLEINEREPGFFDVQWKVPALGEMSLPIQPVFPECMKPVAHLRRMRLTVAHSITLALASLGLVNVPSGPTEAVIALSIVFLAVEIVHSRRGKFSLAEQYPWIVAMTFGLFHGLGFAGALSEVGLPQHEIPLALLMFNVGVELGQIAFVMVILVLIGLWRFAVAKLPSLEPLSQWQLVPY